MSKAIVGHDNQTKAHLKNYVVGFGGALIFTSVAFASVSGHWFNRPVLLGLLAALAIVQAGWQLRYFLHLGQESQPRYKLAIFSIMLAIIAILVFGSLWIMTSLNKRMLMTPAQQNQYLQSQDGL